MCVRLIKSLKSRIWQPMVKRYILKRFSEEEIAKHRELLEQK